jgi:mannosyl-3-phosphoglycerate phosphatase
MQSPATLFFTDLDGSLLDHHSYSFEPALPALHRLHAAGLPLILTTSKTLAEAVAINRALDNRQPVIVENGGAICFPEGLHYPFEVTAHEYRNGHAVIRFSPPYAQIRSFIENQRDAVGLRLRGFGDMSDHEVAQATGLPLEEAARARERLCSEPFDWLDGDDRLTRFRQSAAQVGLRITRGGRYWHLMGDTSKAEAMQALSRLYLGGLERTGTLVALGDGENDREMLQAADIAVVIRRHDGSHLDCYGIRQTIVTEQAGPAGWNSAVLQILNAPARGIIPPEGD